MLNGTNVPSTNNGPG